MVHQSTLVTCIHTKEQLAKYRKRLPEFTQLRTVSATSLMRTFGVICFVWDVEEDNVLIVPYNLQSSHQTKEKMDVSENPSSVAIRAVLIEAGLDTVSEPYVLGSPIAIPNSDPDADEAMFFKYIAIVTKFIGTLRNESQVLWDENGAPVWMRRKLLADIFEEDVVTPTGIKKHPQLEAFRRFDEYAFAYLNFR